MKILHLNTFERTGGAALGTYFLHRALVEAGVESLLYTTDGLADAPDQTPLRILKTAKARARKFFLKLLHRLYPQAQWDVFSVAFSSALNLPELLRQYSPDILHVHWVTGGFLDPRHLAGVKIPVVVTLRDFWFFTGGCHYPAECPRFLERCGRCPVLGSNSSFDYSFWQARNRQYVFKKKAIHFVAISEWMKSKITGADLVSTLTSGSFPTAFP